MLYVAGEAPPGTLVRLYVNDELVGDARATPDRSWLLEAKKDVPVGEVVFRVEAVPKGAPDGTPVVEATAPFMRYAEGIVLEPIVTASSEDQAQLTEASMSPTPNYIIIRRGDNLWRIARRNYGRGHQVSVHFHCQSGSHPQPALDFSWPGVCHSDPRPELGNRRTVTCLIGQPMRAIRQLAGLDLPRRALLSLHQLSCEARRPKVGEFGDRLHPVSNIREQPVQREQLIEPPYLPLAALRQRGAR